MFVAERKRERLPDLRSLTYGEGVSAGRNIGRRCPGIGCSGGSSFRIISGCH